MAELINETDPELMRASINSETAKIPWQDLQRFYASGKILSINTELDLVEVALAFQQDNTGQVEQWLKLKQLETVSVEQAKHWIAEDSLVWAVVVKPWVLIQASD